MFELADRLVGIYKTYNCTKSVTINPDAVGTPTSHPITNKVIQPHKEVTAHGIELLALINHFYCR